MTECTRCGEPIQWVRLPSGAYLPADPTPTAWGHLFMLDAERGFLMSDADRRTVLGDPEHPARGRVLADHRRTCDGKGGHPVTILSRGSVWEPKEERRRRVIAARGGR